MKGRATRPRRAVAAAPASGASARTILDAASAIVVQDGASALTMRRLATALGTSTMVLYSRFGSREAVMAAVLAEGFSKFADTLAAVSLADPVAHLRELGRAYRRFARENPTSYRLMWSGAATPADCDPSVATPASTHGLRAFGTLVLGVTRVLARADRPAKDAEPLALCVWSVVHGFVSLELSSGMPPGVDADAAYERTLDFALSGLSAAPPA